MDLDSLWPWRWAGLAFAVALAWGGLLRLLHRPGLGGLGAGIGLAAGVALTLGSLGASPRQLPERLPLLLLAGTAWAMLLELITDGGRRVLPLALGAALAVLAGAWWLAGAPMAAADLRRGAMTLLGLAVLLGALLVVLRGPWPAAAAAGLLLANLWVAAPVGPWVPLAAVLLAASLGALVAAADWEMPARLPLALGLGALAAGPVLARGVALDWIAGAGPVLLLWAVPVLAERLHAPAARFLAWAVAAGVALLFTVVQRHGA